MVVDGDGALRLRFTGPRDETDAWQSRARGWIKVMGIDILNSMVIYTSASVALNFKASNLTHRGVIATGPYRFVRHPAYTCKNLAWWIAAVPAISAALATSLWSALLVTASVAGWTLIYVLRALTEEDHLRSVDDEYDRYCRQVRWRYLPGIY